MSAISVRYCTQFTAGNKPILPSEPTLASIRVDYLENHAFLCLDASNLYCKGVWANDKFHEAKTSHAIGGMVEGAQALGQGHTYKDLLGNDDPTMELTEQATIAALSEFFKLNTPRQCTGRVLWALGYFSLTFIEPCRQRYMYQKVLMGEPGELIPCPRDTDQFYHRLTRECWVEIRSWGHRCDVLHDHDDIDKRVKWSELDVEDARKNVLVVNKGGSRYRSSSYRLDLPPRRGV
uniref:rRNA N-glycosylase n=1 Tax=Oryza brachyantha TaxID=4533 RepID=J3M9K0_ORYBR